MTSISCKNFMFQRLSWWECIYHYNRRKTRWRRRGWYRNLGLYKYELCKSKRQSDDPKNWIGHCRWPLELTRDSRRPLGLTSCPPCMWPGWLSDCESHGNLYGWLGGFLWPAGPIVRLPANCKADREHSGVKQNFKLACRVSLSRFY